jgi:hypothetical protein
MSGRRPGGAEVDRMFVEAVARARDAICAVVRVRREDAGPVHVDVSGTAWAAGTPSTFVTARHVVSPRPAGLRWYVARRTSPASTALELWPVAEILLEDADVDLAVLRVPASTVRSPLPLALEQVADGTRVLTFGCPSARIQDAAVTPGGELRSAHAFLAPFANEGIVSGHYDVWTEDAPPAHLGPLYEFNVSWLNGESGGAVIRVEPFAAFAVMQSYRKIPTPIGDVPGPRRGFGLAHLGERLRALGMLGAG